jgi:predicted phosphodiesterase
MRFGIISDVHGNILALNAVFEDMLKLGGVEVIISLGDAIGYGPCSDVVVGVLRSNGVIMLRGNHEEYTCAEPRLNSDVIQPLPDTLKADALTRLQFSDRDATTLLSLPVKMQNATFLAEHCPTDHPDRWPYVMPGDEESHKQLSRLTQRIMFMGHSHIAGFMSKDVSTGSSFACKRPGIIHFPLLPTKQYLINPGSVGQPRDKDPRAAYTILELLSPNVGMVYFRRVKYDVETTISYGHKRGFPTFFGERLRTGT